MQNGVDAAAAMAAMMPRNLPWNSPSTTPNGTSWNKHLNVNRDGNVKRRMALVSTNGRNTNKNSVVTPLEMYLGLLYPSCPVGIDTKTRKELRDYATRMNTKQTILKSERDRLEALLKRLVAAGGKCGLPKKQYGKRYRLPTKKEMESAGYDAAGVSGKFFYKRPRKPDPVPNPKKGPKGTRMHVSSTYDEPKPTPSKRMKLAILKGDGFNATHVPNQELNRMYDIAYKRRELKKMIKSHMHMNMNLKNKTDAWIQNAFPKALHQNFSFLQAPANH